MPGIKPNDLSQGLHRKYCFTLITESPEWPTRKGGSVSLQMKQKRLVFTFSLPIISALSIFLNNPHKESNIETTAHKKRMLHLRRQDIHNQKIAKNYFLDQNPFVVYSSIGFSIYVTSAAIISLQFPTMATGAAMSAFFIRRHFTITVKMHRFSFLAATL